MFADIAAPPTLVFDWIYLGPTAGLISFAFVLAGLIILFVASVRRGASKVRMAIVCGILFLGCDLLIYSFGTGGPRDRSDRQRPPPAYVPHLLEEWRLRLSPAQESAIKDGSNR